MSSNRPGAAASGYLLVIVAAVLWGLIGLISTGILAEGVSAIEVAFWRALLGGALFLVHAAVTGDLALRRRTDAMPMVAFALVGVSLFYASLVLAIDEGGISLAFILLYTAPLFVIFGAWLLLGEALTARKLVLAPLAVLGIALVSWGGGTGITISAASIVWGLVSGLSYASYYIFGKLYLNRYRPATIYAWVMPLGAVFLLPLVEFAPKSASAWLLLGLLALLSTYVAYLVYYTGLARVEASKAVLVATIEPVVAVVLAALFLGERFGPLGFAGASMILATAVLAALPSLRRSRTERSRPADDGSDSHGLDPSGRP